MHRFQSQSTITRFRVAAILICLQVLLVPAVIGLLGYALFFNDQALVFDALIAAGGVILLIIVKWIVAMRTRCPLCMTPVLATKGCSKHRRAKTVLGSYRLRVALAVLFRGAFFCPYCNEPSMMETRSRRDSLRSGNY